MYYTYMYMYRASPRLFSVSFTMLFLYLSGAGLEFEESSSIFAGNLPSSRVLVQCNVPTDIYRVYVQGDSKLVGLVVYN